MTQPIFKQKLDKAMSLEQFDEVVEAILAGKYSWACVLILRFAGYNPLHYIPYRTYNRLLKENCHVGNSGRHTTDTIKSDRQSSESTCAKPSTQQCLGELKDIGYLEVMSKQKTQIRGGEIDEWLKRKLETSNLIKFDLMEYNIKDFLF